MKLHLYNIMFFLHNKIISNNFFTFESLFLKLFFIIKLKFFFLNSEKLVNFQLIHHQSLPIQYTYTIHSV